MSDNNPQASDFSTQVLPKLLGKVFTHHTSMPYIDIGTQASLDQARRIANIKNKNEFLK